MNDSKNKPTVPNLKKWVPALLFATLAFCSPVTVRADDDRRGNKPDIVDPDDRYRGKSYSQLSAAWWKWAESIPVPESPLTDTTGLYAGVGQQDDIWFLAGVFSGIGSSTVVRDILVPEDTALFFPILNQSWIQFPTDPVTPIDELRALIRSVTEGATLSCEIDGYAVPKLKSYRTDSKVFTVTVPDNNFLGLPAGDYAPCLDNGYYLFLKPLKKGLHTIHFTGEAADHSFALDVTYHIRVVKTVEVVPPTDRYKGRGYAEWSAKWWEWYLEYPTDDKKHPHPGQDPVHADVRAYQDFGDVWFLAGSFDVHEVTVTVPGDKALFIPILNAEASSLEEQPFHGDTAAQQRAAAKFFADRIVNPSLTIDGMAIGPVAAYRVASTQFKFEAPTPWVYGPVGGKGTSVGDGYYVLLKPLPKGEHTLHFGGSFHLDGGDLVSDTVLHLTVK